MKSYKTASYIVLSAILIAAIATVATINYKPYKTFAEEVTADEIKITLTTKPESPRALDKTVLNFAVNDQTSGARISHVDWSITVSKDTETIFKSQTIHSHMGMMPIDLTFPEAGTYKVSVRIASLGTKMLGMDVPVMARTHIMKSGDPMKFMEDPEFNFGTRTAAFIVKVDPPQEKTSGSTKTVDGAVPGSNVKIDFSADPQVVVAGKPVTLKFVVSDPKGMPIMHTDLMVSIKQTPREPALLATVPKTMGQFHGHTGEIAIHETIYKPGLYIIEVVPMSLKMGDTLISSYDFGMAKTRFALNVLPGNGGSLSGSQSSIITPTEPNHVAIIGQDTPYYNPNNITVKAGTTVTFKNSDAIMHTATGTDDGPDVKSPTENKIFDTGLLKSGQEKQVTFDKPGTYNYFCQIHPFMIGTVTVTG